VKKSSLSKAERIKDLLNDKATDADKTLKEGVVMQDECGDTLWDDVLAQQDTVSHDKTNIENEGGDNSGENIK